MKSFNLRALQLCELEILKEVDRICKKHDIEYFVAYGTAIGAVRHKGFIPWDDDVDIHMKMGDYVRFKKICKTELQQQFYYQDWYSDPYYYLNWAKLRKSDTTSLPCDMTDYPINWGVCIDIFPLMPSSTDYLTRWQKYNIMGLVFFSSKDLNDYGYGKCRYENKLLRYLPRGLCRRMREHYFCRFMKDKDAPFLLSFSYPGDAQFFPKAWFDMAMDIDFEDARLPIMRGYDEYLTANYNNYMQIPAEHDRIDHGDLIVDLEKGYNNYITTRD